MAGYGSVKGRHASGRDTVFEFFVIRSFRKLCSELFRELLAISGAEYIECQTNDLLLSSMLYEFSRDISSNVVLFEDRVTKHGATETRPVVLKFLRNAHIGNVDFRQLDGSRACACGGRSNRR